MNEAQPTPKKLEFQTYSNREFINNIHTQKYEDCIEALLDTLEKNDEGNDLSDFQKRLASLYWSVIPPRWEELPLEYKTYFELHRKIIFSYMKIELAEGIELLDTISRFMYKSGVLRTENRNPDLAHIFIKKLEPRRPHHGTI